jgi:hypothetical protein
MRPDWTTHDTAGSPAGGGIHNTDGADGAKLASAPSALQTGHA